MLKNYLLFLLLLIGLTNVNAQTLPPERAADWSLAGLYHHPELTVMADFQALGGNPDGITPNDSLMTAIIDNLNGNGLIIYFPAGNYLFNQSINLTQNIILQGESSDSTILSFDLTNENHAIQANGSTSNVVAYTKTAPQKGDYSIEFDAIIGLQQGDYVKLYENDSVLVTSSWAKYSTGQILKIDSIAGTTLFMNSPIRRDYLLSRFPLVIKLSLIENIGIENLKILRLDSTGQQTSNIMFRYAANCWVKCIESQYCNFAHIEVEYSTNIEVTGSYIHGAHNFGNGGKAYGVMLHFSTGECLVQENIFDTLRHSMIVQAGANGNVFAYNYSNNPHWTDVFLPANSAGDAVCHGNYAYANLFEGNTVQNIVIDDSHGINGPFNTFFRNRAELYGIFMNFNPPSDSQNIIGNEITNNSSGLLGMYALNGVGHFEYGNNQVGNIIPLGTDNLTQASLFLTDTLPYHINNDSWPPIGFPNVIDENIIQAEERYNSSKFTKCVEDSIVIDAIEKPSSLINHRIYPNPNNGSFIIKLENQASDTEFELYSLMGTLVLSQTLSRQSNTLNINSIPKGVYVYHLFSNNKSTQGKIIIQ